MTLRETIISFGRRLGKTAMITALMGDAQRVLRGGAYHFSARGAAFRALRRGNLSLEPNNEDLGFRTVLTSRKTRNQ